jgi:hypothetical protein
MKKTIALLVLFLIVGCNKAAEETKKSEHDAEVIDRVEGIQMITYEELSSKLNQSVDFLLYIGRPDCQDCQAFYPVLEQTLNDNPDYGIYYLDIKEFRDATRKDDASEEEILFYENLQEKLQFDWVPTLQRWVNGEVVSSYQYLSREYYQLETDEKREQARQDSLDSFEQWIRTNHE